MRQRLFHLIHNKMARRSSTHRKVSNFQALQNEHLTFDRLHVMLLQRKQWKVYCHWYKQTGCPNVNVSNIIEFTCVWFGNPVESIRLATFTVLPQMSYWGFLAPITPATTGPMLIPKTCISGYFISN
jgi:hypothetical protein